jgi:hypothetical protein
MKMEREAQAEGLDGPISTLSRRRDPPAPPASVLAKGYQPTGYPIKPTKLRCGSGTASCASRN